MRRRKMSKNVPYFTSRSTFMLALFWASFVMIMFVILFKDANSAGLRALLH